MESKDLRLPFATFIHHENGCPILASLGWDTTHPNQQVLYQGMSSLMPQTAIRKEAGVSTPAQTRPQES
jgi:hypothetical protein